MTSRNQLKKFADATVVINTVSSPNEANPSIFHVGHPKDLIEASPTNIYHQIAPNSQILDFSGFTSILNFFDFSARALARERARWSARISLFREKKDYKRQNEAQPNPVFL